MREEKDLRLPHRSAENKEHIEYWYFVFYLNTSTRIKFNLTLTKVDESKYRDSLLSESIIYKTAKIFSLQECIFFLKIYIKQVNLK